MRHRLPRGPRALRLAAALLALASVAVAVRVSGLGGPMEAPYFGAYSGRSGLDALFLLGRGLSVSAVLWAGAVLADAVRQRGGPTP